MIVSVMHTRTVKCAKKRAEELEAMIDRNKVALDIPSELLGSSASITLRVSEQFGRLVEVFFSFLIVKLD